MESQPGKGSIFSVSLPVLLAPKEGDAAIEDVKPELAAIVPESAAQFREPTDQGHTQAGKLKLLIIEDNAQMRSYIRSCIKYLDVSH